MKMVANENVFGIINNVIENSMYECENFTVKPSIEDTLCKDGMHMFSVKYTITTRSTPFDIEDIEKLYNVCNKVERSVERIWNNKTYWTSNN